MAELTFAPSLNKEQVEYALEVTKMAQKIGVPPVLALGIAMKESSLDPNVKDSSAGAIGGMQVMPVHAETFKVTPEQLRDPKINLEIGLKLLKQNLDRTKDKDHPNGNWPMSAALYNAGDKLLTNANIAKNGFPKETEEYLAKLKEYGVFKTEASTPSENYAGEAPAEAAPAEAATSEAPADDKYAEYERKLAQRLKDTKPDRDIIKDVNERFQAQLVGAGTGAAISAKRITPAAIKAFAQMVEEGKIAAQAEKDALRLAAAKGTSSGSAGTAGAAGSATGATGGAGPLSTVAEGDGIRPPGRGSGLFNYGIKAGLTDIEAAKALDMTKQKGGANDLLTLAREGTNAVEEIAPNQFRSNPRFGGIFTPIGGGGGGPRESFKMVPDIAPSPELPAGQAAGLRPMPVAAPISTAPPKPSGLDYVTDLYKGMIDSKVGKGVGTFMRYAGPPAAVAGALGEGMNIKQQMDRPNEQRDYGDMALSGLGAAAGLASLAAAPALAIPAGLTAAGIAGYRYLRDRAAAERANQRMTGSSMR